MPACSNIERRKGGFPLILSYRKSRFTGLGLTSLLVIFPNGDVYQELDVPTIGGLSSGTSLMTRLTASSLFALLLLSLSAYADSDGCYCTSKGYIAYELRAAIRQALDPSGDALGVPHVLRIVRVNQGIQTQGDVAIEDFQVHEIRCDTDTVTIAGYDKNWIKYVVDIRQPDPPRITEHVEEPIQQHPLLPGSRGPTQMYGSSPPEVVTVISTDDPERTYQLVITHLRKAEGQRPFEYDSRAELRQLDSRGIVLQRLLLYHDHFSEH